MRPTTRRSRRPCRTTRPRRKIRLRRPRIWSRSRSPSSRRRSSPTWRRRASSPNSRCRPTSSNRRTSCWSRPPPPSRGRTSSPSRASIWFGPDGTISLGVYGSVYVAGSTLEEVRDAVAAQIARHRGPQIDPGRDQERRSRGRAGLQQQGLLRHHRRRRLRRTGLPHRLHGQRDGAGRPEQDQRPAARLLQEADLGRPRHAELRPPGNPSGGLVRHYASAAAPTPITRSSPATGSMWIPTSGSTPTASWPSG